MDITFTCPTCENHRLEEIMSNVSVASEIAEIDEEGDHNYCCGQENEGGYIAQYQCIHCGYLLRGENKNLITDCVKMAEWVKKNCKQ